MLTSKGDPSSVHISEYPPIIFPGLNGTTIRLTITHLIKEANLFFIMSNPDDLSGGLIDG